LLFKRIGHFKFLAPDTQIGGQYKQKNKKYSRNGDIVISSFDDRFAHNSSSD
jgi:hypothetical protein